MRPLAFDHSIAHGKLEEFHVTGDIEFTANRGAEIGDCLATNTQSIGYGLQIVPG